MTFKNSLKTFYQITEICYEVNHPILNNALPSIEIDVERAETTDELIPHVLEIIVLLEEAIAHYQDDDESLEQVKELLETLYDI